MANAITISTYLKGISQLFTDEGLQYVLAKRRLSGDELLPMNNSSSSSSSSDSTTVLTERDVDLAEGTVYYWLSNLPVGGSTEKVADGGWSHSEGGWTVSSANIAEWLRKYRSLFSKWDEELIGNSRIRILNF